MSTSSNKLLQSNDTWATKNPCLSGILSFMSWCNGVNSQ